MLGLCFRSLVLVTTHPDEPQRPTAKDQDLFLKRYLHQRNCLRIILLFALKTQEIVVCAAFGGREVATCCRSCVINSATTSFSIEELAWFSEKRILLPSQDSFLFKKLREACSRHFFRDAEVFCESANVSRRYLHSLVNRAAVCWAINAIVQRLLSTIREHVSHDR